MTKRATFDHIGERRVQEDGMTVGYQFITCSHPGCSEEFVQRKPGKRLPPEQMANKASRAGWAPDVHKGKHLCPAHNPKHKEPDPMTTKAKTKNAEDRKMNPGDRRAIFRELDSCYSETRHRYQPGHTDKTVALKLDVPVEWIAQLRDENFGPAGPDPEIAKLTSEIAEMQTKVNDAEVKALEAAELADKLSKALVQLRNRVDALT